MKKNLYSILTLLLVGTALSFSSCLKDSKNYVNLSQGKPLAELPLEAYNGVGVAVAEALPISTTPQVIQVAVNIASASTLSTATTFKLALDTAAITSYNTANSTNYVLLPPADYTVPSWTVTVPAGQHLAYLNISVKTSLTDPSQVYMLPIKLVSAGSLTIDQYNELLLAIQVKNVYDGVYTVTGSLSDNTSSSITGAYPETVYLETEGASQDAFYDPNIGFGHAINTSTGASYYGSFSPEFTFSGSTITGVTNVYGQYTGSHLRSAVLDPTGVNKFTAGTPGQAGSVFQVSYYMDQGNPGAPRTHFVETYTYTGARP